MRKENHPRTPLAEVVAAAEAEGLSYGKYVAKHESAVYNYPKKRRRIREEVKRDEQAAD